MRTESRCAVTFSNYDVYGEPVLSAESRRRIAVNYSKQESIERVLMRTESRCAVTFSNYDAYGEPVVSVESRRRIAVNYSVSQRSSDGNVITEHE
ncbi:hypothetical protein CEXT_592561 [Caerostris extrusa]|uniref:Uncharacterized protein n=1 Tax=Caerostris extrusa TaxID=172846 RepID=A0AAV4U7S1_CAEEX|nr:hypothetical protein CEXT_592561 [Caerostris extrusa]